MIFEMNPSEIAIQDKMAIGTGSKVIARDYVGMIRDFEQWRRGNGQVVEGARADRGLPFERFLPPPEAAARAIFRLFFGLTLHASQNQTPSGATSSPIHPKWN